MRQLVWSSTFRRALRRILRRHPHLRAEIESSLRLLQEDAFAPKLATHKLKGKLKGVWACSAAYDLRILFEFVPTCWALAGRPIPDYAREEMPISKRRLHDPPADGTEP